MNYILMENCKFEYDGHKYAVDIEYGEGVFADRKYIQLYMDGAKWAAVSNVDLDCCGILYESVLDFYRVLKSALNDNWGCSKLEIDVSTRDTHTLYMKWKCKN